MAELIGLPKGAQIIRRWSEDGRRSSWWVSYVVPERLGVKSPQGGRIRLAYQVRSREELESLFPTDKNPSADLEMTVDQFRGWGIVNAGRVTQLAESTGHPWEDLVASYKREAEVQPWLRDPEVLALTANAILQGRELTEGELRSTDWWRTRTEGERRWASLVSGDPAQANRVLKDTRAEVRDQLLRAGMSSPPRRLSNELADRFTKGLASEQQLADWIRKAADPHAPGRLPDDIQRIAEQEGVEETRQLEDKVRDDVARWLGPQARWEDNQIARWAGRLRNDPNAEIEFEETLRRQRLSLFPEYENENLTYEDIAAPWRGFMQQHWGTTPDEMDPVFTKLLRTNDAGENLKLLRNEGMERGNTQVLQDLASDTMRAFGSGVREAL